MFKRLFLFLFCFFTFTSVCFASALIDTQLIDNYMKENYPNELYVKVDYLSEDSTYRCRYFIIKEDTTFMSGWFAYQAYVYLKNDGTLTESTRNWTLDVNFDKCVSNNIYYYTNSQVMYDSIITYTGTNYDGHINMGSDIGSDSDSIPPQHAPSAEYNLSTESVLSVIIQLIPIILVFLVGYWGFWKAYLILLKILHKI